MFFSIRRFAVENEFDEEMRKAFLDRPHSVNSAPGFIRVEVANPCADAKGAWLLTWWENAASASMPGITAMLALIPTTISPRASNWRADALQCCACK